MKRLLALVLVLMLALPCLASAEDEKPTVTLWAALEFSDVLSSLNDVIPYQIAQERLGLNMVFQSPPTGQEAEQFGLLIASDERPDIVIYEWNGNYPGGAEAAISNRVILELNDIIEEYMPNLSAYLEKYPEIAKMIKTDSGKIYNVPYIYTATPTGSEHHASISGRVPAYETYMGMFIRRDLLEELGLEMPVTLDDFYDTLVAFKEYGVEVPFTGIWGNLLESAAIVSAFDIAHDFFLDVDGKTVRYGRVEEGYRDYLTYMNKLYAEGLLDPDFAVIDGTTLKSKILKQQTGVWTGYTSTYMGVQYDQIHSENPESKWYPVGLTNPKQTEDQTLLYRQASYPYRNSGAAITTSCKNVEAAAKWLDYFWSEEGDMLINWGVEGESYQYVNGYPTFTDKIKNDPNGLSPTNAFAFWRIQNGPFCMDHQTRLMSKGSYTTPESINALTVWETTNGLYPAVLPPITLLEEESAVYADKYNEINTYANEMRLKFIMGEVSLDEFDAYVANIYSMGLEQVLEIEQAALDRYNAR